MLHNTLNSMLHMFCYNTLYNTVNNLECYMNTSLKCSPLHVIYQFLVLYNTFWYYITWYVTMLYNGFTVSWDVKISVI